MLSPAERAKAVVKNVRDHEMFNVVTDAVWEREIAAAIQQALSDQVPIADLLELHDAAHAVIDKIRMHVDHAEYEGGMNAVGDFREIAAQLRWKHDDKVPGPLNDGALAPDEEC